MKRFMSLIWIPIVLVMWLVSAAMAQADIIDYAYTGQLGKGTSQYSVEKKKFYTWHDFTMDPRTRYTFTLRSRNFDSYLILRDNLGKQIATNDDGAGYPDARIVFQAPAYGTYRLFLTTFGQNQTGRYELQIREERGAGGGGGGPAGEVTVNGHLSKGPEFRHRTGCYYRAHPHMFIAGNTYTIDLATTGRSSSDPNYFDTYLFIMNGLGNVVASNDDGGDGYNSRITNFRPVAGENYTIVVTSYRQHATGGYRLRIRWH